jgi:hypothetical protein
MTVQSQGGWVFTAFISLLGVFMVGWWSCRVEVYPEWVRVFLVVKSTWIERSRITAIRQRKDGTGSWLVIEGGEPVKLLWRHGPVVEELREVLGVPWQIERSAPGRGHGSTSTTP